MRIEGSTLSIGTVVGVTSTAISVVIFCLLFFAWKAPTEERLTAIEQSKQTLSGEMSKIREDISYIRGLLEKQKSR